MFELEHRLVLRRQKLLELLYALLLVGDVLPQQPVYDIAVDEVLHGHEGKGFLGPTLEVADSIRNLFGG